MKKINDSDWWFSQFALCNLSHCRHRARMVYFK
ncbi:hypothetical protein SY91_04924 [Burkholderia cenocepacia]|nr:hypothetical protein SY91_04924 [Burkholderia cenocepacia]